MKYSGMRGCLVAALITCSATALAATPTQDSPTVKSAIIDIPEPTDLVLFLLGVAGLVIGRRSGRKRLRQNEEQ